MNQVKLQYCSQKTIIGEETVYNGTKKISNFDEISKNWAKKTRFEEAFLKYGVFIVRNGLLIAYSF